MIKIKESRMTIYSTNGNEICHTTKDRSIEDMLSIVDSLLSGKIIAEVETANVQIRGNAVYFNLYNLNGELLLTSNVYFANNGTNPRNAWTRALNTAKKGILAAQNPKYLSKIIVM